MTHPLTETLARALCIAEGEPVDVCAKFYDVAATAAIEAIHQAGYAIVPGVPSEAMIEAGHDFLSEAGCNPLSTDAANAYRAMLQAAEGERG